MTGTVKPAPFSMRISADPLTRVASDRLDAACLSGFQATSLPVTEREIRCAGKICLQERRAFQPPLVKPPDVSGKSVAFNTPNMASRNLVGWHAGAEQPTSPIQLRFSAYNLRTPIIAHPVGKQRGVRYCNLVLGEGLEPSAFRLQGGCAAKLRQPSNLKSGADPLRIDA